jgi:hypothetical protein
MVHSKCTIITMFKVLVLQVYGSTIDVHKLKCGKIINIYYEIFLETRSTGLET